MADGDSAGGGMSIQPGSGAAFMGSSLSGPITVRAGSDIGCNAVSAVTAVPTLNVVLSSGGNWRIDYELFVFGVGGYAGGIAFACDNLGLWTATGASQGGFYGPNAVSTDFQTLPLGLYASTFGPLCQFDLAVSGDRQVFGSFTLFNVVVGVVIPQTVLQFQSVGAPAANSIGIRANSTMLAYRF